MHHICLLGLESLSVGMHDAPADRSDDLLVESGSRIGRGAPRRTFQARAASHNCLLINLLHLAGRNPFSDRLCANAAVVTGGFRRL